jgi:hypothetical protein
MRDAVPVRYRYLQYSGTGTGTFTDPTERTIF